MNAWLSWSRPLLCQDHVHPFIGADVLVRIEDNLHALRQLVTNNGLLCEWLCLYLWRESAALSCLANMQHQRGQIKAVDKYFATCLLNARKDAHEPH